MAKQYLDLTGLQSVIGQIKTYYLTGSTSASPKVGWAENALSANEALTLHDPQNFSITGDVSATAVSFNGSTSVVLTATIADAVASTGGEGGSHGLMTAANAEKLAGIAAGAQVNVIESVSVTVASTTSTTVPSSTVSSKAVTIELPQYALKTDITASMRVKGVVDYYGDIATQDPNPEIGDVYIVRYQGSTGTTALNAEYVYAASNQWEEFGNTVILNGYATETWVNNHDWSVADITDWSSTEAPAVAHAVDAEQLKTARTFDFTGDVTGTQISFNGTTNVSTTLTIGSGVISDSNISSSAAIAQSKISGLTTDLAAKMPKIGSTDATAHEGEVAVVNSDGTVTFGGIKAEDLISSSAIDTKIATAIDELDTTAVTGAYLTGIGETNGKLTDIVWGTVAASTTTSTTTDFRFAAGENSKLVSAGEVTKVLDGDGYFTPISVSATFVADTTAV